MKKLLSVILAVMLVITACPLVVFADGHTVRTETLVLGTESMSNEQEGWSYDASSNTLVLNNVTIDRSDADCDGLCISAGYNLNLVLEGESTLISKTDYMVKAINAKSNLNISGTGTLNINEGNRAINSENMVLDSGSINITHDKSLYEGDANAMLPIVGIVNISAVNGGTINSDAACMISEVNGGELNVSEIASTELTVNGGEINADMIVATDITVNNGLVNVSGGSPYDATYYYNGYDNNQFGIVCEKAFEINGGTVNTNGDDVTALYSA